ncbi:ABC transporter permease [Pelagibius sp.]|uniref:ABC transporter permease n=1 Tax=Pelagibius sp. TaxID=1931238 RepID=UPI0026282D84|nr:ABC transporter permease [Pelagibius sp.]
MKRYLIIRLFQSLLAMLAISMIAFVLSHLSGSPVDAMLPDDAGPEEAERLIRLWGLDRPYHEQYLVFLGNALQGNLGDSIKWSGQTAMGLVLDRLPATLQLGGFAIIVSTIIALPIGVLAAVYKDSPFDSFGKLIALLGQAMPNFWLGIVLIWVFAVTLNWFPTSGRGGLANMILPAIAMGWFQVAALMRLTRSAMLEVLDSEYVKLARIKGVPEWRVVWVHAFRNAAIVPLTYFGLIAGSIFTGSVVIETVFAWPGTGLLAIDAIRGRDFPVVQAVVLTFAGVFILANLIVDTLYAYLDPRIRYR